MWRLQMSFGHFMEEPGYCSRTNASACHIFPVAIGEFGSTFEKHEELDCWQSIVLYLNARTEDGRKLSRPPITSWWYWTWNPNSYQTGTSLS
jgi:hypothetical protein